MSNGHSGASRFFFGVTAYPRSIIAIGLVLIVVAAAFLPGLVKDTSADAFISKENPAMIYRDHVKKIFGLEDPFVVAVVNTGDRGVFNPNSLELVRWLTDKVKSVENIDPERVTSLATEKDIRGTTEGMTVEAFLKPGPITDDLAKKVRESVAQFPLYQGTVVARDGSATVIVAESLDESKNRAAYAALLRIAEEGPKGPRDTVYVAGEGAASGYLGEYIDADMQRLNPLAGAIITLVLFVAFRTLAGTVLPNVIVLATVAGAIGTMAAVGIPFYIITNGLMVILIGISVADSIHILSRHYELIRQRPDDPQRQRVVQTMVELWRPVTMTSLTTIAGFAGLYLTSAMPPMRYFGVFAAVGVFVAWVYSMIFLPAAMVLMKPKPSPAIKAEHHMSEVFGRLVSGLGRIVLRRAHMTVALAAVVVILGAYGASCVIVEDQRITNFQRDEPIYVADKAINKHMDGVYYFDIVVETPDEEGIFDPHRLRRIEALQRFAETLPHINGSTSVVDYIKKMNQSMNEGRPEAYRIPDSQPLVAQLFLAYSASANPTDFEQEIDTQYRRALVRLYVDTDSYQNNRKLVPQLANYIDRQFNTDQMKATITGRLQLDFHWIDNIAQTHVSSFIASLALVWLICAIMYRSAVAGLYALVPVGAAVLLVYAVMGFAGIPMGVGTSMFATIAIGLGVDFAIHVIDKLRNGAQEELDDRLHELYPGIGRALLFNVLSLALGFLVLTVSEVPSLMNFGALVAVAVTSAFLASMTLLPAMAKLFRPSCFSSERKPAVVGAKAGQLLSLATIGITMIGMVAIGLVPRQSHAAELPSAKDIIAEINSRDEGVSVVRGLRMELIDKGGTSRVRDTKVFRKYYGNDKRFVIFYLSPANIKGTAFLTYSYQHAKRDDDQWLYLPGVAKVRRISASDRGDYFLGTDFTYEDIKNENKVEIKDYNFEIVGTESVDGAETVIVEGKPVDAATARELGYGKVRWYIDRKIRYPRRVVAWDVNGNELKTTDIGKFEVVDGILTATQMKVVNHKTGHQTVFVFSNIDYEQAIPDRIFTQQSLQRGGF